MKDAREQVKEAIERRQGSRFEPLLEPIAGTYRFEVDDVGAFRMRVDHGNVEVVMGTGDADCVIRCDAEDFLRIARGEQNLVTASMQGRVAVEGNLALAQKLHGFLPRGSSGRQRWTGAS